MLKEKKELVEYLRSRCNSLVFNQEKLNEITTQIEAENKAPINSILTETPVRIMINTQYERAFDNQIILKGGHL